MLFHSYLFNLNVLMFYNTYADAGTCIYIVRRFNN